MMKKYLVPLFSFLTAIFLTSYLSFYYYKITTNKDTLNFKVSDCIEEPHQTRYLTPQSEYNPDMKALEIKVIEFLPKYSSMLIGGYSIKNDNLLLKYYLLTNSENSKDDTCPRMLSYSVAHLYDNIYKIEVVPGDEMNIIFLIGYQVNEIIQTIQNFNNHSIAITPDKM